MTSSVEKGIVYFRLAKNGSPYVVVDGKPFFFFREDIEKVLSQEKEYAIGKIGRKKEDESPPDKWTGWNPF